MTKRRHPTAKLLGGKLRNVWHFLAYVLDRFTRDSGLSLASALAYTTLLALVPMLAIGLAMLAAFPVFHDARQRLQEFIFTNFVPEVGDQVQQWVQRFVDNAGQLTALGIVGLSFTAVMLLLTIEGAINQIFRVEHARRISSRLFVYWTIITLGPLLVGTSFSLAGALDAIGRAAEERGFADVERWAAVLPTVLVALAFAILYYAVPNRRVRMRDAALGGLLAALAFTLLRWSFAIYIGSGRTYETLYGTLAAVPIFLAWLYFSWVVVLLGAVITAALPEWRHGHLDRPGLLPAARRLALAADVLHCLYDDHRRGSRGISRRDLLAMTAAGGESLLGVLHLLQRARLAVRLDDGRYMLGRDPDAVTLYDLVRALDLRLAPEEGETARAPWQETLLDRLASSDTAERNCLDLTLRELFGADDAPRTARAAQ